MDPTPRTDADPADASAPQPRASARVGGRAAGLVAVAIGAAAYRELLWYAPQRSFSEEFEGLLFLPSQGVAPLVVLLAGWLLYRRAGRLRSLPPASAPRLGWGLVAAGALVYCWATLTSAPDLLVPSLALVGFGAAALWKGGTGVRAVLLPGLFLLFAMPLPAPLQNEVLYRLQLATAQIAGALLSLLGIPNHVAGEQILRTRQTFSVIESCSGLRSIETLTMVAILMADLFGRSWRHALLLVLAAPPVAFLLNGFRALALILNPYSQIATVHNAQGIAMLLGGLILLYLFDGLLERLGRRRRPGPTAQAELPRGKSGDLDHAAAGSRRPPVAGLAALLVGLALASFVVPRFEVPPPEGAQLADGFGNLLSQPVPTDRVFLGSAGFRDVATRRFEQSGHSVDVFVGVGWRPGRARSALSPKTAIPGSGWVLESHRVRRLEPDGRAVQQLVLRSGPQRVLAYHWYEGSAGLVVETLCTLVALDSSPFRRSGDILALRMATPIDGTITRGLAEASERLDGLYEALRPAFDELPRNRVVTAEKLFPFFPYG